MNRKQRRTAEAKARKQGIVDKNHIDLRGTTAALIKALTSDDPGHKQHWIEWALRQFLTDEWVDGAKAEFKWPDGVDPEQQLQPAEAPQAQGGEV